MMRLLLFLMGYLLANIGLAEEGSGRYCNKYNYMINGWSPSIEKQCLERMEKGEVEAIAIIGLHLIDNNKSEAGLALLEKAGDAGNDFALYWLGIVHLKELVPGSSPGKSINYLKRVRGELEISALTNMAVMYAEGVGVPADIKQAIYLFKRAQAILEEPLRNLKMQEKINSDEWLRYQWFIAGNELAAHLEKYNLDMKKMGQ
jgi:hypothetical protein